MQAQITQLTTENQMLQEQVLQLCTEKSALWTWPAALLFDPGPVIPLPEPSESPKFHEPLLLLVPTSPASLLFQ